MIRRPPRSTLFPYTRSSDLFLELGPTRLEYRMLGPRPDAAPTLVLLHERSEEHTSELQSRVDLVCRLLLEKKKAQQTEPASPALRPSGPPEATAPDKFKQSS